MSKRAFQTTTTLLAAQKLLLPRYKIEVLTGQNKGLQLLSEQGLLRVGTHEENELSIQDPHVSRFHLVIERSPTGYRLRDLESTNGTVIGNIRIVEAYLSETTDIWLGETCLRFSPEDQLIDILPCADGKLEGLLGESDVMRGLFGAIRRIARYPSTVLLLGETGTGKEGLAQALHKSSPRANEPFVVFDCTAVSHSLFEAELFGHVKGAFTGAEHDRLGALQKAHKGTLFIDEIGELPLELQPKLLRALEQQEYKPLGSDQTIKVDLRVISATHRDLREAVEQENFRADLYYRLAVVEIPIPALRERKQDITLLAKYFFKEFFIKNPQIQKKQLSYEFLEALQKNQWLGNVRELKNAVNASITLSEHQVLTPEDLPKYFHQNQTQNALAQVQVQLSQDQEPQPFKQQKALLLKDFEQRYIAQLLVFCEQNISKASRVSGLNRKHIYQLMEKHGFR